MSGALVVVVVGVVCAALVAGILVHRHVPAEGLVAWLRDSFGAFGRYEPHDPADDASGTSGDLTVADILAMSEEGPAYHTPVDLREVIERTRAVR